MTEQESLLKGADQFYVWFDTEYSTLELETALLLQVAALIHGYSQAGIAVGAGCTIDHPGARRQNHQPLG